MKYELRCVKQASQNGFDALAESLNVRGYPPEDMSVLHQLIEVVTEAMELFQQGWVELTLALEHEALQLGKRQTAASS